MKTKTFNVMVLSVGRRVELIQLMKEAINNLGLDGKVLAADASILSPALYFADHYEIIPKVNDETYIPFLIQLVNDYEIDLIVPTIDTELLILSANKAKIESETKTKVVVSNKDLIELFSDKKKSNLAFKEIGINVPEVYSSNDSLKFPVFIKPRFGSSSIGAVRVSSEIQLLGISDLYGEMIIQEYLNGKEFTIDCMVLKKGMPSLIVPRERISIRSGEVIKGKVVKHPILIDVAKLILSRFPLYGPITIQGILVDEIFYVIEVNPRLGGGVPMSILSGATILEDLISDAIEQDVIFHDDYRDGKVILRYDQSIEVIT